MRANELCSRAPEPRIGFGKAPCCRSIRGSQTAPILFCAPLGTAIQAPRNILREPALRSHQNDRLQLLLNLTNRITSNLDLRELLRAISANIREVMQCDAVGISLPDPASGNFRLYALDCGNCFPTIIGPDRYKYRCRIVIDIIKMRYVFKR